MRKKVTQGDEATEGDKVIAEGIMNKTKVEIYRETLRDVSQKEEKEN